ncbi:MULTISPECIES: DoxX family protein [Maribacter]|jgi:putative oxidoreductase|uniref:Putative oxidoreductase n=1 Tax=Maribacter stanieri TaxID=440514 RepID=A0A1I6JWN3_9FLAO|nr:MULTISPECIES: DoxX family protein [Maribacter]SFR83399.1 putative oxidoreductase [Maribacter stanieri]|tara:strand:- start:353 stop:730 length:378 start_codon:yes stop_codon:yes gene_type:complete
MKNTILKDIGLAFFRIAVSAMMLTHGLPKFQKLISGDFQFADPIGIGETPSLFLAVIGEFICPILVIIGFKTRLSAIPTAITMAIAAFLIHGADDFGTKEKAVFYLVSFVTISLLGPGKFGIDRK